jgi:hypothetical protein
VCEREREREREREKERKKGESERAINSLISMYSLTISLASYFPRSNLQSKKEINSSYIR